MRNLVVVALVVAGLVLAGSLPAQAQQSWVRGTVAGIAGDTLTVKVNGQDMAFKVDKDTKVVARGAGTAAAKAAPVGGPKIGDLLKAGENVEVHYTVRAGANHASMVRGGLTAAETASTPKEAGKSVYGKAETVANDKLTVTADGKEYSFAVTMATKVVGEGAGTLTREKAAADQKPVMGDFVKAGDYIVVSYETKGAVMEAAEVRVVSKGSVK